MGKHVADRELDVGATWPCLGLALVGVRLLVFTGLQGGDLVYELGVNVRQIVVPC